MKVEVSRDNKELEARNNITDIYGRQLEPAANF